MEDPEWWQHERRPHNDTWRAPLYMETSCMTRKIKPFTHPYLSHMERHPKILETLSAKSSQQGKILTLKGFRFTIHHYISTRPPLFSSMQKIPSSFTIEILEISHSLTWPSKGSWSVPHQCLLFGPCVFTPQVFIAMTWSLQLIDDFSTSSFGTIYGKRRLWLSISPPETKELHGPNAFDGYHQPGNRKPVQCPRETGTNPACSGRAINPAQPGIGTTAKPKERATSRGPTWRARCRRVER